jgi:hypothetical protein
MQADPARCSECGGEMEVGFIIDFTHSGIVQQRWARGPAEKRWIGGVKVKQNLPVTT